MLSLFLGLVPLIHEAHALEVPRQEQPMMLSGGNSVQSPTLLAANSAYVNGCSIQAYLYIQYTTTRDKVRFDATWSCSNANTRVSYRVTGFRGSTQIASVVGTDTGSGNTYTSRYCSASTSREYTSALDATVAGATRYVYSARNLSYWCG